MKRERRLIDVSDPEVVNPDDETWDRVEQTMELLI
jgi:hypothetical protein